LKATSGIKRATFAPLPRYKACSNRLRRRRVLQVSLLPHPGGQSYSCCGQLAIYCSLNMHVSARVYVWDIRRSAVQEQA
jgi:hypothetical protein